MTTLYWLRYAFLLMLVCVTGWLFYVAATHDR
jgi:hypothetical protein